MHRQTLYSSLHNQRQIQHTIYQRVFLSGYFNQEEVKRDSLNVEQYIRDSLGEFKEISCYVYVKGVFYIQVLESQLISNINKYLQHFQKLMQERSTLINMVRIVHQSYENTKALFKGVTCDNNPQPGPILGQTEKTDQQIQDRSFEIYELFMDGARKKIENPSHKIGNMIVMTNDDMAILNGSKFMSLPEYLKLYVGELQVQREQQSNYPLPPSFFELMQFLQTDQYQSFMRQ